MLLLRGLALTFRVSWSRAGSRRIDAGPESPDLLLPAAVGTSTDKGSDWARFEPGAGCSVAARSSSTTSLCRTVGVEPAAALIAEGLSSRALAEKLVISHRTVDGHGERILAKVEFTSRIRVVT